MLDPSAVSDRLGYTPVNKAGDTISGTLTVDGGASLSIIAKAASSSAQIKLERTTSSAGVGYIGADSSYCFRAYDSTLSYAGLNVDNSGRVTKPYQPSMAAYKNNGAVNGAGQIIYNGTLHNVGNCYNSTTGRFTAPITGTYFVSAFLISTSSGGAGYWSIRKNGSAIMGADWTSTNYINSSASGVLQLNANDYLDVYNYSGNIYGSNSSENMFSVHQIG